MKLKAPFIKLPFTFDVERLRAEVLAFPAEAWAPHPNKIPGNSALRLITVGGTENDDVAGAMAPTRNLLAAPYLQQVLSHFGVVWSRSRLMKLGPRSEVPTHTDVNYHWFHRVRMHIPIVTTPDVKFYCDDQVVNMAAGESWIFDNWRTHRVVNGSDVERIHLVADTTGNARFWDMADAAAAGPVGARPVPYRPGEKAPLAFERFNVHRVMPPSEIDQLLSDLVSETVSVKGGPGGEAELRAFERACYGFRQDWRQLWSLFADEDRGVPHYRKRIDAFLQQVRGMGEDLRVGPNDMPVLRVAGARVAAYAVNEGARGQAAAAVPGQGPAGAAQPAPSVRTVPTYDRPIIIAAAPRSGSTALFETLAVTPQLHTVGGEAHWLAEGFPRLRPGAPGVDSNRLTAAQFDPQIGLAMHARVAEKLRDGAGTPFANQDSVRFLEKTPKNALRIPFFDKVFPDARYVFLWREPEENVSSIIDAWRSGGWITYPQLQGWDGPWSLLLPPEWRGLKGQPVEAIAAHQWAVTNTTIMDDLEALPAEHRHVVRYADFVADPGRVIAAIADFAGLEVDAALTERTGGPLPDSRHTLEPPRPDKWKKNAAEIGRVLPGLEAVRERLRAFR
ncbi:MAG: sulfotransferase [Alphaproteobacteria bacterium]|nr:sulfotransferase [Alphaproteobacteria bacterium]MBU1526563.1 sulfotransferase [Alphaproteobacteria bacterium]MBU2116130.1 sulfotransferase [Alphaproteobacteria bacterium]MBU2351532.1 sulfotransferase [Alphaproteobacteria bacterium]MBU2381343.1 sulfotransferase [Alphaproteobacteria bacterium]